MKPKVKSQTNASDEIPRLVRQFQQTLQRLQELTGGELDSLVIDGGGPYLLQAAQEQLRQSEAMQREAAATQSAILNALPAHIALIDPMGIVLAANAGWLHFSGHNGIETSGFGPGQNYLDICDRSQGRCGEQSHAAAAGMRAVMAGEVPQFSLEYSCPAPSGPRWYRLVVNPLKTGGPGGVVVMHVDMTERKLAENSMRESEERFRGMFAAAATGIAISTPSGRFLEANSAYCRMLGYTEAELRNRDFASITHPDDLPLTYKLREELVAGERENFVIERRYLKKEGGIVWGRHSVSVTHQAGGEIGSFIVVAEDITESKQAQEKLLQKNSELQALFDLLPAMVWFKDTKNGILRVNQRAAETTGRTVAQLEGKSMEEIFPNDAAKYFADDLEVIRTGAPKMEIMERLQDRHGREILVQTAKVPVLNLAGRVTGIIVMAEDITERRRTEAALRQSEQRFKALFEQAAVGVIQVSATTGKHVQVNQRFCDIVGRRPGELVQLLSADISHPLEIARCQHMLDQVKSGVIREFTLEKRYLRPDGSEVWAGVAVSAMWAPGDAPDYFMAVVQDITTRRHLEDAVRQAQKMEAMGTLAGGIAHDFNNILASINGYTHLAQMVMVGNPEVREYLDSVLQAGDRAAALVRQILSFSRQERLERAPVQLGPILEETLKLLRATIPVTTEFGISLAPDAPTVLADANQIHQIMMNLGTNAWHALPEGAGGIKFRLESCLVDEQQAIWQPRLRPGLYARVSVSDTGCGMDPATLRRIFEPFFTTKPPGVGTGLGLSVVHGIMETHDGIVVVESQPGIGTVFHLYFPALINETTATAMEVEPVPLGSGERILLVDDEELLAQLGLKTLSKLGYEVVVATQPLVALEMVRKDPSRFALVISDQTMPGMTGLELARQLLKIRPGLPIILTTGFSMIVSPEIIRAVGIRQLLYKPISVHSLGSAIQAALATTSQP